MLPKFYSRPNNHVMSCQGWIAQVEERWLHKKFPQQTPTRFSRPGDFAKYSYSSNKHNIDFLKKISELSQSTGEQAVAIQSFFLKKGQKPEQMRPLTS